MSTITLLGCGSSVGAPWITGDWRNLKKKARNIRTRCCAHIRHKDFSILIDTSPDIKNQCIQNNVRTLDAVLYTHAHADQSSGIFELRPFFWKNKKEIPIYGSSKTINDLKKSHRYCFVAKQGYLPIVNHLSLFTPLRYDLYLNTHDLTPLAPILRYRPFPSLTR